MRLDVYNVGIAALWTVGAAGIGTQVVLDHQKPQDVAVAFEAAAPTIVNKSVPTAVTKEVKKLASLCKDNQGILNDRGIDCAKIMASLKPSVM